MEYDCHIFSKYQVFQSKYLVFRSKTLDFDRNTRYFDGIRLSHIFEILSISNQKPSISIKILRISIEKLVISSLEF